MFCLSPSFADTIVSSQLPTRANSVGKSWGGGILNGTNNEIRGNCGTFDIGESIWSLKSKLPNTSCSWGYLGAN